LDSRRIPPKSILSTTLIKIVLRSVIANKRIYAAHSPVENIYFTSRESSRTLLTELKFPAMLRTYAARRMVDAVEANAHSKLLLEPGTSAETLHSATN